MPFNFLINCSETTLIEVNRHLRAPPGGRALNYPLSLITRNLIEGLKLAGARH